MIIYETALKRGKKSLTENLRTSLTLSQIITKTVISILHIDEEHACCAKRYGPSTLRAKNKSICTNAMTNK